MRCELIGVIAWAVLSGCPAGTMGVSSSASGRGGGDSPNGAATSQTITIPDVTGKSPASAEAAMRAAGVRGGIEFRGEDRGASGATACGQNPGADHPTSSSLSVMISLCVPFVQPVDHSAKLVGLTPDEATKRARAAGFTGMVTVETSSSMAGCTLNTVCQVDPLHWELNQDNRMTLWVAKSLPISLPD